MGPLRWREGWIHVYSCVTLIVLKVLCLFFFFFRYFSTSFLVCFLGSGEGVLRLLASVAIFFLSFIELYV